MQIYNYDGLTGEYLGPGEADESPLEPDIFLDPANSTRIAPPAPAEDNIIVWKSGAWGYARISDPDAPPSETPVTEPTDAEINAERDRRIEAGATIDIPGYGRVPLQGRQVDQINLNARAQAAQLKIAVGDTSSMVFRDALNQDRELTPQQMLLVFVLGSSWVESQYKASWVLKAMTPKPGDFTDEKWWVQKSD
jgi:hypothetical protein